MKKSKEKITPEKFIGHLNTVSRHKYLVMKGCFSVGLYRQGIMHDLSKFSPTEFMVGARYWQGNRSPNNAEREEKGYSASWLHHKGRNRHHFEYWVDYNLRGELGSGPVIPVKMPGRYVIEMLMDRIAAHISDGLERQTLFVHIFEDRGDIRRIHGDQNVLVHSVS